MKQVYSWLTSSRTPEAMTLAWGAKAHGRRRHPGPIFFRPLMVKGFLYALTGRAAFLFRGNTAGFPIATVTRAKRPRREGHHGLPAALCTVVTPPKHAVRAHVTCAGHLPLLCPTTTPCSPTRWLGPRRHAEEQHLPKGPHPIRQPSGHRWCPRLPHFGRARTVRRLRL
jgi:hypothetical protein